MRYTAYYQRRTPIEIYTAENEAEAKNRAATIWNIKPSERKKIRVSVSETQSYRVKWDIDLDAKNARDAARQALKIHRDPASIATVFDVMDANGKHITIDTGPSEPGPGLSSRELATVLGALRHFQTMPEALAIIYHQHFEEYTPLTPKEIDRLCERLNCGGR